MLVPFFIFFIPVEPTFGILIMFLATGLDVMGQISEKNVQINFALTYFHLALFITFYSILMHLILKRNTIIRSANLWPPLITFYLMIAFSLIYTPAFSEGSFKLLRVIVMGIISLIVIECLDKDWKVRTVIWGMILIPVGISILTIYQLLTEGAFYPTRIVKMATSIGLSVYRSTGTFDNPNTLGCFLMIGIVFSFSMLFIKKQGFFIKLILIASLVITSVGVLASFSRTAWLSTLVTLFGYCGTP